MQHEPLEHGSPVQNGIVLIPGRGPSQSPPAPSQSLTISTEQNSGSPFAPQHAAGLHGSAMICTWALRRKSRQITPGSQNEESLHSMLEPAQNLRVVGM